MDIECEPETARARARFMCEHNAVISENIIGTWHCMTHQSHHDFASTKSGGNKAKRTSIFRRHMMIMMRDIFIYFPSLQPHLKAAQLLAINTASRNECVLNAGA